MSDLTTSEIYKWRCLVALAHADGKLTLEEMNVLKLHFRKQQFTADVLNQLNQDLARPQDFKTLYKEVASEDDKRDLLQLAHTLFWSDSDFDEAEQKLYEYIEGSLQG